jgi:hypothetical protein
MGFQQGRGLGHHLARWRVRDNALRAVLVASWIALISRAANAESTPNGGPDEAAPPKRSETVAPMAPGRPVRMMQWFNDCVRLSRNADPNQSATAKRCFWELSIAFRTGRDYQCTLWGVEVGSETCEGTTAASDPVVSETLRLAGRALKDFEHAAMFGQLQGVENVARLRAVASRALSVHQQSFSLVSQGGVSLGSWQAGYLYLVTEVLKRHAAHEKLDRSRSVYATATGASAGAVNALAFGLEGCSREFALPEETLGFKVWVDELALFGPKGQPGLFDPQPHPLALFNDGPLERALSLARAELVGLHDRLRAERRQASEAGYITSAGCAFNLGFVVTHMKPRQVPVHVRVGTPTAPAGKAPAAQVQMSAPRLTERFMLEVGVNGEGRPYVANLTLPTLNALTDSALPDEAFVARLGKAGKPDVTDLLNGVRASGAFPIAFTPVQLDYQTYDVEAAGYTSKVGTFVDGGTLDNTPIGLAATINRRAPYRASNPWFADLFSDPNTYLFINPSVKAWRQAATAEKDASNKAETMLSVFGGFAVDLMSTGFDAQLMNTAESLDFIREDGPDTALPRMTVPQRHLPIAGEQLAHFLAFAERDFREFDFAAGMADARVHLLELDARFGNKLSRALAEVEQHLEIELEARESPFELGGPSTQVRRAAGVATRPRRYVRRAAASKVSDAASKGARTAMAKRYACLRDVYGSGVLTTSQTGPVKLPESCRGEDNSDNHPRLLRASIRYRHWTQSAGFEAGAELATFINLISEEGFGFPDTVRRLGTWTRLDRPEQAFRHLVDTMAARLAEKHDVPTSWLLRAGSRVWADAELFRDFPNFYGAGIADSGVEVVAGWPVFAPHERLGFRLDVGLRSYRWDAAPLPQVRPPLQTSFEANTGVSIVWGPFLSPGMLDFEFGGGVFGESRWIPSRGDRVGELFGVSAHLGGVLYQRLYLLFEYQHSIWSEFQRLYVGTLLEQERTRHFGLSAGWRFALD